MQVPIVLLENNHGQSLEVHKKTKKHLTCWMMVSYISYYSKKTKGLTKLSIYIHLDSVGASARMTSADSWHPWSATAVCRQDIHFKIQSVL